MTFHSAVRAALPALVILGAVACDKKPDSASSGSAGSAAAAAGSAEPAKSDTIKVGLIGPFSGPFADIGKQIHNGIKAYVKEHGDSVAGKKVEILVRDTTGPVPEVAKRLAQELAVQDKVDFLVGFGLTPEALAAAPVATEARTPMIIMNAATSIITTKSPYIVRFSMTLPQVAAPMGTWAAGNGIKKVSTLVADYGPGIDAEGAFTKTFTAGGGQILGADRAPLKNPEFSSFVQRIKDEKPDAVFVFLPSGEQCIAFMKSFHERGLADAGIKVIATGDLVDDHALPTIGDPALGIMTTHHYSLAHDSPENKAFLKAYLDANGAEAGAPNFMSVAAYDGMAAIYEVARKLNGAMDADKAMGILKGMTLTSPRGQITIDPETRDIVQTVYLRKVDKVNGELRNVELQSLGIVKDPVKAAADAGSAAAPAAGSGSAAAPK